MAGVLQWHRVEWQRSVSSILRGWHSFILVTIGAASKTVRAMYPSVARALRRVDWAAIFPRWRLSSRLQSSCASRKLTSSYYLEPNPNPLLGDTYGACIDKAAERWPDDGGWIFAKEGGEVTYGKFKTDVNQACKGLLSAGFQKGDSVAIWSPNTYNWIVLYGALAKAGIISACIHPAYTAAELERCLLKVGCKGIYIPESYKAMKFYQILNDMIPELKNSSPGQLSSKKFPFLRSVLVDSNKSLPGCINIRSILEGGTSDLRTAEKNVGIDDPLTVVFTSGTTGCPKAALISHHGFVNNALAYGYRNPVDRRNSVCCPLPFFHVFGMMIVAGVSTITGTKVIIPSPGYDIKATLEAVHKYRCVELSGAPTMHLDILAHPDIKKYDLTCVKKVVMGGNICTPEVRKFAQEKLKAITIVGYGATETTTAACLVAETDPEHKRLTTVGKPLPFVEVKVADPATGKETAITEPGEIWVRGYNVFLGYHGEEERTRDVITPARWYRTGDVGTMDEEGYVTIMGRLKDMVIRGGENIYPIEVEGVLNAHPAVEEALVIGVPDQRMGEELCGWIIPRKGSEVRGEDLQDFCKGKISHFKIPRYFIFETDYPKTAIGKPQKAEMRAKAQQKLGL